MYAIPWFINATSTGHPPSVKSVYTAQLSSAAFYCRQEQAVYAAAIPRPVTPAYPSISGELQTTRQ